MLIPRFGETDFIEPDREVKLHLLQKETPYQAVGRIVEVNQAENWFKLKLRQEPEAVERREFVRVPVEKPMKYKLVTHLEAAPSFKSGRTINISTGGIKFQTKENTKVESGNRIMVYLPFLSISRQQFQSHVVYRQEEYRSGQSVLTFGVEFLETTPSIEEKLAKWLFEKQRQLRKQGKIK